MPNILDIGVRRGIIADIEGDENKRRKAESLKRFEVYNERQREYVLEMLSKEFGATSVRDMRTCTSINLTKRIVDEMASIYSHEPTRTFEGASDKELEQLNALYADVRADMKLKWSNRKYKLHDQCSIQIIPKMGGLKARILAPHHYDVIPSEDDPEVAYAYVISVLDKQYAQQDVEGQQDVQGSSIGSKNAPQPDQRNQEIGDQDDWRDNKKYVWWSAEHNFITDANGAIQGDPEDIKNPIERLPFIEISLEKDFEYWVRKGSGIVDFNLDFSVALSDTCNTNRLQAYAQPVISAESLPQSVLVGPQQILFLPIDPNRPEVKPSFEFANPSPDMKSSLELLDRLVRYFLTSKSVDPKTVSGTADADKFASGVERLLAMIDKFEASQDDVDLYRRVEQEFFSLVVAWSNVLQSTSALKPELNISKVSEDVKLSVQFSKPQMIQTQSEVEDSTIKQVENRFMSRREAIMKLRGVSQEEADRIIAEIDAEESTQFDNTTRGNDNGTGTSPVGQ